ncbi:MAG: nucleotidyltransferase domain-containing protein [Elusimicrobia bacterium]|nr:nucleotidyltransferase domain-containing protein [Elusimicrobiota bacterium]
MASAHILDRPLDWVFSAPCHVAILRALMDSKEGMSGRAVARRAGINHQACARALRKLEDMGITRRHGSGKTQLVLLNFEHALVASALLPLLRKERETAVRLRAEIVERFSDQALSATLFGSVARGEAGLGSDVDLLLTAEPRTREAVAEDARQFASSFMRRYGFRLSPIVLTPQEVKTRIKRSDPLILNVCKDGIELLSRKLEDAAS